MPTSSPDWSTLASEYERLADSSAMQASPGPALAATAPAAAALTAAAPAAAATATTAPTAGSPAAPR
jgi:hypothetical protein